jgi:hypothetical protein
LKNCLATVIPVGTGSPLSPRVGPGVDPRLLRHGPGGAGDRPGEGVPITDGGKPIGVLFG